MRVSSASNVLSYDVSSALDFLAEEKSNASYLTTSWFVKYIARWFQIMTARHPFFALGKKNMEVYNKTITFLQEAITFFLN